MPQNNTGTFPRGHNVPIGAESHKGDADTMTRGKLALLLYANDRHLNTPICKYAG
jgi:hypothetical protein